MSGRPPTTVEGRVKTLVRQLRGPSSDIGTWVVWPVGVIKISMAMSSGSRKYPGSISTRAPPSPGTSRSVPRLRSWVTPGMIV